MLLYIKRAKRDYRQCFYTLHCSMARGPSYLMMASTISCCNSSDKPSPPFHQVFIATLPRLFLSFAFKHFSSMILLRGSSGGILRRRSERAHPRGALGGDWRPVHTERRVLHSRRDLPDGMQRARYQSSPPLSVAQLGGPRILCRGRNLGLQCHRSGASSPTGPTAASRIGHHAFLVL